MSLIRTIISFEEDQYYALKDEAAKKRQSLSAVVREKIPHKNKVRSKAEVERIMAKTRKLAKENAKYLKGLDGVTIIREMRDNAKW